MFKYLSLYFAWPFNKVLCNHFKTLTVPFIYGRQPMLNSLKDKFYLYFKGRRPVQYVHICLASVSPIHWYYFQRNLIWLDCLFKFCWEWLWSCSWRVEFWVKIPMFHLNSKLCYRSIENIEQYKFFLYLIWITDQY